MKLVGSDSVSAAIERQFRPRGKWGWPRIVVARHAGGGIELRVGVVRLATGEIGSRERLSRRRLDAWRTGGRLVHIAEVDGDGANIGVRHDRKRQSIANDRSHRGAGRTVQRARAGAQEGEQIFLRPRDGRGIGLGRAQARSSRRPPRPHTRAASFRRRARLRGV